MLRLVKYRKRLSILHTFCDSTCVISRMYEGNFEDAAGCFQQSAASLERWYGRSHPRVADVLNDYAGLLCNHGNKVK